MLAGPVRAQSTLTPDEYNALVAAVESTPSQPASEAPLIGNFYTITHGESWPPLPSDTLGLNFWSLGGNYYLLDDRGSGYNASWADFEPPPSLTNVGSGGSGGNPYFTPPVYTSSDLWLQITTNLVGSNAILIIHPPSGVTEGVYDVLTATNLTEPILWQWLLRTDPGQTSLPVPIGTNAGTFYALGKPNDFVANDSLGTNFWLAFPTMLNDGNETLSLYISSPFAASGTVTIANQSNGPVLIVANSGDSAVNGTYILTNIYVNPSNYLGDFLGENNSRLTGAPVTNAYQMGSHLIFYDNSLYDEVGWALVDTNNPDVLYESIYGTNNLNDQFWIFFDDPSSSVPPSTSCDEFPLIQTFSVTASNVAVVPVPTSAMISGFDAIGTNNAIEINANAPVSVYAFNFDGSGGLSAAFTGLPTSLLGTNYCLMARPAAVNEYLLGDFYSEFAIVATESNTTLTIMPSSTAGFQAPSGTGPFTNTLQLGQAYRIRSSTRTNDVTGTWINADKPIVVVAGANVAFVPDANTYFGNPLVQEQLPVDDWGTNVVALSFAGRSNGATYRVLAAQDDTVISITGGVLTSTNETNGNLTGPWAVTVSNETVVVTTNAGRFFDIGVDGPVQFQANRPIQVAQFANGVYFDNPPNQDGDPCEVLLPPIDHYLETNILFSFGTNTGDFVENYLNVIVPQSATNSTFLDSSTLITNFVPIGASGYYGAQISITGIGAVHRVASSQPVGFEAYGWAFQDGYAYFGGIVK